MDSIDPTLLALAVPVGFFVNGAVDIVKRVVGRSPHRRWLLPLWGTLFGWLFVGLTQVYREAPLTAASAAGTLLAGFLAYLLAALLNDQGKRAEASRLPPPDPSGRG